MNKQPGITQTSLTSGYWYAIAAYTSWGLLPLYWKQLQHVPAIEILAHRVLWSMILVSIVLLIVKRWVQVKEVLSHRTNRLSVAISGFLISANWFIYIWAINSGHVIDTSLGYYINPLLSIILGMVILKEKLNFWQSIAVLFAALGVAILTVQIGTIPWVAVSLALSFALYGLAKKLAKNIDPLVGLLLETAMVVPIALVYLSFMEVSGEGALGSSTFIHLVLLIGSGLATALPLLWFAQAAKRLPLSTVGIFQYLSPTITLFLGIFLYGETFTPIHLLSFGLIWFALALYTLSRFKFMEELQPKHFKKETKLEI
jgi:chloramphenicol-sensitive protein RarD